jgi:hypothetical protein
MPFTESRALEKEQVFVSHLSKAVYCEGNYPPATQEYRDRQLISGGRITLLVKSVLFARRIRSE